MRALALVFLVAGCGMAEDDVCTNCQPDLDIRDLTHGNELDDLPLLPMPDLVGQIDQSVANDLTIPPDFAGDTFCANTMVASTCVQSFFQMVADCYPAPPPQCTIDTDNSTYSNLCYGGGDKMISTIDPNTGKVHTVWSNVNKTCLTADITPQKGNGPVDTFTFGAFALTINEAGGTVTCPDGTTVVIGANFGACPDLQNLVRGSKNCQAGACQ